MKFDSLEEPLEEIVPETQRPDLFFEAKSETAERRPKILSSRRPFAVLALIIAILFLFPWSHTIPGVARVEAEHSLVVEALVPGELNEIYARQGDVVKKGDKLGLIYDRINELELAKALDEKAVMEKRMKILSDRAVFLKKRIQKNENLFASEAISANDKETGEFEYFQALQEANIAETELNSVLSKIRYLEKLKEIGTLRAPIDGMVLNNVAHFQNTYFEKGERVLKIGDMRNVILELPVYETQLRRVEKGQRVEIRFYGYPETKFRGHVAGIYPTAYERVEKVWIKENVVNVQIKVESSLPFTVRSGMTAKVLIHCKGESLFTKLRSKFL